MIAYLVRHGEAENNQMGLFPDDEGHQYALTPRGREQVRITAKLLSGAAAEAIVSSPVRRARETAELISEVTGLRGEIDDRLREAGLGALRGRALRQVLSEDSLWYEEYFQPWSKYGVEKYASIQGRIAQALQERSSHASLIVISHLEPIRSVVARALGISGPEVRRITIMNASVTILRVEGNGGLACLAVNCLPPQRLVEAREPARD